MLQKHWIFALLIIRTYQIHFRSQFLFNGARDF
jgi:hypothetical protein